MAGFGGRQLLVVEMSCLERMRSGLAIAGRSADPLRKLQQSRAAGARTGVWM